MRVYKSTALPKSISVRSVVAVLDVNFHASDTDSGVGERHNFPEIQYVAEGGHNVLVDGEVYRLSAGQMIMYAPNSVHTGAACKTDSRTFVLSFEGDFSSGTDIYNKVITLTDGQRELLSRFVSHSAHLFVRRSPDSAFGGMVFRDGVSDLELERAKLELELFLADLFAGFGEQGRREVGKSRSRRTEYERIVSFLKENLYGSLTLSEIARGCSMGQSKLKLLVKEFSGSSPVSLYIDLKLAEAARLIVEGEKSLTEIADDLGFSSLHYFSRLFKKRIGVPPSEYTKE